MNNNTIITIENLSKKYDIAKGQSGSLRETLSNVDTEEFWALRDINLEV